MKMYVANPTHQDHEFTYRMIEGRSVIRQPIPSGGQIRLTKEMSSEDIDYVTNHHAKYGLVRVDEVNSTRGYISLLYSIDKPINAVLIMRVHERNKSALDETGKKLRRDAAIATQAQVSKTFKEEGLPDIKAMEFEIVEEERKDAPSPTINEIIRAVPEGSGEPQGSTAPRGNNRGGRR